MDRLFLVEKDYIENTSTTDGALWRWTLERFAPYDCDEWQIITTDEIKEALYAHAAGYRCLPIGSLHFTQQWFQVLAASSPSISIADAALTPIEIPSCLFPYVHRFYAYVTGAMLLDHPNLCNSNHYFIKNASHLKTWNSLVQWGDVSSFIEPDTVYTVSDKVTFSSEWRLFVYEHQLVHSGCYLGEETATYPDSCTVTNMINALAHDSYYSQLGAYTLDVGLIQKENNKQITVPLEVHPFVACGLYNWSDKVLLEMVEKGYAWYRSQALLHAPIIGMYTGIPASLQCDA